MGGTEQAASAAAGMMGGLCQSVSNISPSCGDKKEVLSENWVIIRVFKHKDNDNKPSLTLRQHFKQSVCRG